MNSERVCVCEMGLGKTEREAVWFSLDLWFGTIIY